MEMTNKYRVYIKGKANQISLISPCFVSDDFRIVMDKDQWFLETIIFEDYTKVEEVQIKAKEIINEINIIISVYSQLHTSLEIDYIIWRNKEGKLKKRITGSFDVNVYSGVGLGKLKNNHLNSTFGNVILNQSQTNPKIKELLRFLNEKPLRWIDIYNIIEYIGKSNIPTLVSVKKNEVEEINRTANHFRHLGNPKNNSLSNNAPSIQVARNFTHDLLQKWLESEIKESK